MTIFKDIINSFPIYYKNEEYIFYYYDCDALKNEVDNLNLNSDKIKFCIQKANIYSARLNNITGKFIIGKQGRLSDKFPYPFILDCDCPILIEAANGKIVKTELLSDMVLSIRKAFISPGKLHNKEAYNSLYAVYGKDFLNDILPYEDILYYFG